MKKLLYFTFALCFFTTLASAQKVTEKDLQGKWKLTYFIANGVTFDIVKEKVTISDEAKSMMSADIFQQLQNHPSEAIEPFKAAYADFDKGKLKQIMGADVTECVYTIIEKDGQQFVHVTYADGASDDTGIVIKDKQLYLTITGNGDDAQMIYSKQ